MADLMNALCTCPGQWRGYLPRPKCVVHEPDGPYDDFDQHSVENEPEWSITMYDKQIVTKLNLERQTKNFAVYNTGRLTEGLLVRNVQYLGLRELTAEFGEIPLEVELVVKLP